MTLKKGKEQDGMMLAKVKEQDGIMLAWNSMLETQRNETTKIGPGTHCMGRVFHMKRVN